MHLSDVSGDLPVVSVIGLIGKLGVLIPLRREDAAPAGIIERCA